jgi:pimeloyl-ACP methyl ester carboxylesterase
VPADFVRSFDGVRIAYTVQGSGPATLLLHGFAADHVLNWARPGVIDALTGGGRRRHRDRRPGPWRVGQAA